MKQTCKRRLGIYYPSFLVLGPSIATLQKANIYQGGHRKNYEEAQNNIFNVIAETQYSSELKKRKKEREKEMKEKKPCLPRIYLGVPSNSHLKYNLECKRCPEP